MNSTKGPPTPKYPNGCPHRIGFNPHRGVYTDEDGWEFEDSPMNHQPPFCVVRDQTGAQIARLDQRLGGQYAVWKLGYKAGAKHESPSQQ